MSDPDNVDWRTRYDELAKCQAERNQAMTERDNYLQHMRWTFNVLDDGDSNAPLVVLARRMKMGRAAEHDRAETLLARCATAELAAGDLDWVVKLRADLAEAEAAALESENAWMRRALLMIAPVLRAIPWTGVPSDRTIDAVLRTADALAAAPQTTGAAGNGGGE